MFSERSSVGLDVHARSVAAAGLDSVTGQVWQHRLRPDSAAITAWLAELPGPVAVTYEAGPTGFGLARDLTAAGIRCEVAVPSKIRRAPGDRVKTDARDALLLARLLRMDDLSPVTVPSIEQEAARDLVRAREDCRTDVMRARHRLSKLLLRHGLVWDRPQAWTQAHDQWLRQLLAYRDWPAGTGTALEAAYQTVATTTARRDRLDAEIVEMAADSEFTPTVRRLGCLRGISTLTGFALAVEIGDWTRFSGASIGAYVGLTPSEYSSGASRSRARSPRPATPTSVGCWSRPPGITDRYIGPGRRCRTGGPWPRSLPRSVVMPATGGCIGSG